MTNNEKQLAAQLHYQENKNAKLQGRLDCAVGQPPGSDEMHYLSGYGEQAAIEAIHDSITSVQF